MHRRTFLIFSIFFLLLFNISPLKGETEALKKVDIYEGATLYRSGEINVIELHGTYREMGKQYGYLLKEELFDLYYLAVEKYFIQEAGLSRDFIKNLSLSQFTLYPERFKNILYGISETSEMELYKLIILDQIIGLGEFSKNSPGCSSIAAWGDYTSDNLLVFGRNFDWIEKTKEFDRFITVVVYNPTDGSIPVGTIGYTGQIQTLNGMNKSGIFLQMNDGSISGGKIIKTDRVPSFIMFFSFLFDNSTLEQLDASIKTTNIFYPSILNVADKNRALSYEWATFEVKKREGQDEGLMVATNHFIHPLWNIFPPPGHLSTVERMNNLLKLGEKYKGTFSAEKMMEVLDTKVEKGGATKSSTLYQIVAVPQKLTFWLKSPDIRTGRK